MVSNILYFHPYFGKIPILTIIFQMGWNHQPVTFPNKFNIDTSSDMMCFFQTDVYISGYQEMAIFGVSIPEKKHIRPLNIHDHGGREPPLIQLEVNDDEFLPGIREYCLLGLCTICRYSLRKLYTPWQQTILFKEVLWPLSEMREVPPWKLAWLAALYHHFS